MHPWPGSTGPRVSLFFRRRVVVPRRRGVPFTVRPRLAVTAVLAQRDLGLDVQRQVHRLGIAARLWLAVQVGKDRVGLLDLLQGLGLLDTFDALAKPVEDTPEGAFLGQILGLVALLGDAAGKQGGSGQAGILEGRLELRVGLGVRLDQVADVLS